MKSSSNDRIDVGFVARAHGVRGVVRVRASTDLRGVDALWIDGERFVVRHASRDKDEWLVTLEAVGSREAADALRGKKVSLPRDAVPVGDDELLVADLVGCKVLDVAGTLLGEVTGSFDSGAHEVVEVRAPDGKEFMLPLVDAFVTNVDLDARIIICDPPPGLVNLDEAD